MAYPPMVYPSDLDDFPGAPFPTSLVEAAEASIRAEAGWHIAPVVTETLTLDTDGGTFLRLPSLRVVSVDSVVDADAAALGDYTLSRLGTLYRRRGWPWGFGGVAVTLTHGFDAMPAELVPVVVDRCRRLLAGDATQRTESVGPFTLSETFRGEGGATAVGGALARYRLPPRFA